MRKQVCIVVCMYNEVQNVKDLTLRLAIAIDSLKQYNFRIIYCVSGDDGTLEVIKSIHKVVDNTIEVVYSPQPYGLGLDFMQGFLTVDDYPIKNDYIITMDADLNHQPEEMYKLLAKLDEGYDVCIGSRYVKGGVTKNIPFSKSVASKVGNFVYSIFFGNKIKDKSSGFRGYTNSALQLLLEYESTGFEFLMEMYLLMLKHNLKVAEVPITFVYRTKGESKFRFIKVGVAYFKLLWGFR